MVIATNILSLGAHRNLSAAGDIQARASQRLSSGFRINSAADDAAGLGISEKMRAQIRGLNMASRNAQDGISLIQTAEGALSQISEMIIRMRELSIQAANDTNTYGDREKINVEVQQLKTEIDEIALRTEFNTKRLLDGTYAGADILVSAGGGTPVFDFPAGLHDWLGGEMTLNPGELVDFATVDFRLDSDPMQFTFFSMSISTTDLVSDLPMLTLNTPWTVMQVDMNTPVGTSVSFTLYGTITLIHEVVGGVRRFGIAFDTFPLFDPNAAQTEGTWAISFDNSNNGANSAAFEFFISTDSRVTSVATLSEPPIFRGGRGIHLQIGANPGQSMTVFIESMRLANLGIADVNTLTREAAKEALSMLDSALSVVTSQRSILGAQQNRLEFTIENLEVSSENLQSANSRIRDADMAKEMMRLTLTNVLQQAAVSILAQSNQKPDFALQLLRA